MSAVTVSQPMLSESVVRGTFYDGPTYRTAEVRCVTVREDAGPVEPTNMNHCDKVARFWREVVSKAPWFDVEKECVALFILNRKNNLVGWNCVSQGTQTASLMHPREVMRAVLVANGCGFILAHNHPSGDPAPSTGDVHVTRAIREAAKVCDVEFLDHVVIGRPECDPLARGYYSFREAGML